MLSAICEARQGRARRQAGGCSAPALGAWIAQARQLGQGEDNRRGQLPTSREAMGRTTGEDNRRIGAPGGGVLGLGSGVWTPPTRARLSRQVADRLARGAAPASRNAHSLASRLARGAVFASRPARHLVQRRGRTLA